MVNVRVNDMVKGRVSDMVKGKNKPPSRIRYEQNHPVISIRVDRETAKRLKDLAKESGKSLATLIKENLDLQEGEYSEAWSSGYDGGYDKGRREHQIWFFCAICRKRINITPNSNIHEALVGYMKEHGWAHKECHKR